MKKQALFFACLLLLSSISFAQITVNKPPVTSPRLNEMKPVAGKTVAFRLSPFNSPLSLPANVPAATGTVLNLTVKEFDLGNDVSGTAFVAPENGVYHFDARIHIVYPISDQSEYLRFHLLLNKNGQPLEKTVLMNPVTDKSPAHTLAISTTVMLKKGDAMTVSFNADANSPGKAVSAADVSFSGFKVSSVSGSGAGGTIR